MHSGARAPARRDTALAFLFKCDKYLIYERVVKDHMSMHKGPSAEYATRW